MNGDDMGSEAAFSAYVDSLVDVIGHADLAEPLSDYCLGLMLPVSRKSVEPLAAVTDPARVSAKHQSLLHFDNCQVAVSLSVANTAASLPVAYRLYLPESWANDPERRQKAKVAEDVAFQTKPAIALDQIRTAQSAGITPGVVLAEGLSGIPCVGGRLNITPPWP